MYIKKPDDCEEMVMNVLHLASEVSSNPDLRDRGYIYWRMLSTDPAATKDVVLAKRPDYTEDLSKLLDEETREIFSDIGIVRAKRRPAEQQKDREQHVGDADEIEEEEPDEDVEQVEPEDKPKSKPKEKKKSKKTAKGKQKDQEAKEVYEIEKEEVPSTKKSDTGLDDLLGIGFSDEPSSTHNVVSDPLADIFGTSSNGMNGGGSSSGSGWADNDIFGGSSSSGTSAATFIKADFAEVLNGSTPGKSGTVKGLQVKGRFHREGSTIKLDLVISNMSSKTASDFEMLFNKNSFGLTCGSISVIPLSPGQSFNTTIECSINSSNADMKNPPTCPYMVQTALNCSLDVFYFQIPCLLHVLFTSTPIAVTQAQCQQMATTIANKHKKSITTSRFGSNAEELKLRLGANSVYHIYDDMDSMVFATSTINNIPILVRCTPAGGKVNVEQ